MSCYALPAGRGTDAARDAALRSVQADRRPRVQVVERPDSSITPAGVVLLEVLLPRSALIISIRRNSNRESQIPEPLLIFTSRCPLKVQISQGLGLFFPGRTFDSWPYCIQSYISEGTWRQGIGSFTRNSYVSTLCPVVICPCLCPSDASATSRSAFLKRRSTSSINDEKEPGDGRCYSGDLIIISPTIISEKPVNVQNNPCQKADIQGFFWTFTGFSEIIIGEIIVRSPDGLRGNHLSNTSCLTRVSSTTANNVANDGDPWDYKKQRIKRMRPHKTSSIRQVVPPNTHGNAAAATMPPAVQLHPLPPQRKATAIANSYFCSYCCSCCCCSCCCGCCYIKKLQY